MTPRDAYQDCLNNMYGLRRFGIKLGLATIEQILKHLGNPQDSFNCIHIAGTNGKGSVASMLAAILKTCGCKTGLYTSPHLVRFNERISVNGHQIPDDRVIASYEKIQSLQLDGREPTFFEFTTAMALYEFSQQGVDWAVIETGMGGRLDATNVIKPALSIITNISVEHREYLGNTIREIAAEKAGIIKPNTPVITGVRQKKAIEVIGQTAAERSAEIYRLGKDIKVRRGKLDIFTYFGLDHTWRNLQTGLAGSHQVDNAALVLAACELLGRNKINVTQSQIQAGLHQTSWPGGTAEADSSRRCCDPPKKVLPTARRDHSSPRPWSRRQPPRTSRERKTPCRYPRDRPGRESPVAGRSWGGRPVRRYPQTPRECHRRGSKTAEGARV